MESRIIINKKIVKKYNNFFLEVVEHYDLESFPMKISLFSGLQVLDISKLAERLDQKLEYSDTDDSDWIELNFIHNNYRLLLPFFELYNCYYNISFTRQSGIIYLCKINDVLMEVRKGK